MRLATSSGLKLSGVRLAGLIVAIATAALIVQLSTVFTVHALNTHAEIKADPPGIARIVARDGRPPRGQLNLNGNRPTALTINTDVEFGTVFPGETDQGEFIVHLNDSEIGPGPFTRVEYHLVLATAAGFEDMAPYLTVLRDPAETDSEADTVASASLDSTLSDVSDRWLVTLTLPDDPPPGDYWTTITVEVDSTTGPP
jgi:hypothetical protein